MNTVLCEILNFTLEHFICYLSDNIDDLTKIEYFFKLN